MKVLVATSLTQGSAEGDVCSALDGELVTLPMRMCEQPECSCRHTWSGAGSCGVSSTALVRTMAIGSRQYHSTVYASLAQSGAICRDCARPDDLWCFIQRHLDIAREHPVGTVLEVHNDRVQVRTVVASK